jgi:hypothetical protein
MNSQRLVDVREHKVILKGQIPIHMLGKNGLP